MSGAPATADSAGISRTTDGTIAPPPPTSLPGAIEAPAPTTTPTTIAPVPGTEPEKADDGKPLINKDNVGGKAAPEGAPDKYEDFKTPAGYDFDSGVAEGIGTLFKELGLSQAQGQKLVDFYAEHAIKSQEEMMNMVRDQQEAWKTEAKNHPDLRGKLDPGGPIMTTISRALDSLGSPQLKADFLAAMDASGMGNHHAFIRTFYGLASKLAEGSHVAGNGPSPLGFRAPGQKAPSAAQALYPNLPSSSGG